MKKTVVLPAASVMLCVLLLTGCASLSGAYESDMAHATPTATVHAAPVTTAPIPTLTPVPIPTPFPKPTPEVREEVRFSVDLDGDGRDETIVVSTVIEDPSGGWDMVSLGVLKEPGNAIYFEYVWFSHARLTWTKSGKPCVLVCCDGEDGELVTYVCSFDGLTPVLREEAWGRVEDVDGIHVTMSSWAEFIGYWWYTREYELTNDFKLKPVSDMMIATEGWEPLITLREVSVEMWEDGAYVEGTLPEGTSIWPVSADGEGHMTFKLQDGRTGRITYTRSDGDYGYTTLIDGVNVDECFENIEYWG